MVKCTEFLGLLSLVWWYYNISVGIASLNAREPPKEQTNELTEKEFLGRSSAEWQTRWHSDCHRRCRQELVEHIRIACEKDIYRVTRDELGIPPPWVINKSETARKITVNKKMALSFLTGPGGGVRIKRGIMEECCMSKGCTWEEYAETCRYYSRAQAPTGSSSAAVCN
ncbi:insulin-like peptide 7 [Tubulanus polymorphus]|uniref:insulin-like peptide 7 n=1 Tax=Tubulanus polymorphus TaxID=672921 RepID=UPI003DA3DB38